MADKKISVLVGATTPLGGTEVLPIVQGGATVKVAVSDLTAGRNVSVSALTATSTITGDQILKLLPANVAYGGMLMLYTGQTANTGARNYGWINSQNAYGDVCLNVSSTLGGDPSAGTTVLSVRNFDLAVSAGNLVIGTAGKGIDFSATAGTGTSELLADYEEGTWTPVDASGAGIVVTIYDAKYTKVGNLVTITAGISYAANVSAASALIGGLPFTPSVYVSVPMTYFNNGNVAMVGLIQPSVSNISVVSSVNSTVAITNNIMPGNTFFSVTYQI